MDSLLNFGATVMLSGGAGRGIEVVGDTSSTETYPPYFEVYMWYRTA